MKTRSWHKTITYLITIAAQKRVKLLAHADRGTDPKVKAAFRSVLPLLLDEPTLSQRRRMAAGGFPSPKYLRAAHHLQRQCDAPRDADLCHDVWSSQPTQLSLATDDQRIGVMQPSIRFDCISHEHNKQDGKAARPGASKSMNDASSPSRKSRANLRAYQPLRQRDRLPDHF